MNLSQVYFCGWPIGLLVLQRAVVRPWKDPEWNNVFRAFRGSVNTGIGLMAMAVTSFLLWWLLAPVLLVSFVLDHEPEDDEEEMQ